MRAISVTRIRQPLGPQRRFGVGTIARPGVRSEVKFRSTGAREMPKRGGAKVSGCRSGLIAPRPAACRARQVGVGLTVGIVVLFAASPGFAYRPFDGTDAAVADLGEVEIEFHAEHLLVDMAGPPAIAIFVFAATALGSYARNERRERALRRRFEQHLAPDIVRRLVDEPDRLRLDGEARQVTAMFTD